MTSDQEPPFRAGLSRRLRWAGALIAAGSIIEIGTLFWNHTVSLLLFLGRRHSFWAAACCCTCGRPSREESDGSRALVPLWLANHSVPLIVIIEWFAPDHQHRPVRQCRYERP